MSMMKIEPFTPGDLDSVKRMVRDTLAQKRIPHVYSLFQADFASEALAKRCLIDGHPFSAYVAKLNGEAKAAVSMVCPGNENSPVIFPFYEMSPVGSDAACDLVSRVEAEALGTGATKAEIYGFMDMNKDWISPFRRKGYVFQDGYKAHPFGTDTGFTAAWMIKSLKR